MLSSKEALKKLNNLIWREKHINSERNKIVNDCVNQIKQDLERLEVLEISNKEIEELYLTENKHWCETIDSLRKENEKLSIEIDELLDDKLVLVVKNKQQDMFIEKLTQENKKLKEAVTMLYLVAKLYDFEVYDSLDEKDRNLLEEVLSYE